MCGAWGFEVGGLWLLAGVRALRDVTGCFPKGSMCPNSIYFGLKVVPT